MYKNVSKSNNKAYEHAKNVSSGKVGQYLNSDIKYKSTTKQNKK